MGMTMSERGMWDLDWRIRNGSKADSEIAASTKRDIKIDQALTEAQKAGRNVTS